MPLPDDFNPWEHLQGLVRQLHNREIREYFKDVDTDTDDITTPRASLKLGCEIRDNDTATMTLIRMMLYHFILRGGETISPYYGTPIDDYQAKRKFRPQIQLNFREDKQDIEPGYQRLKGEITFRLMDEKSETITENELRTIAQKIKSEFGSGGGFIWKRGRKLMTYTDPDRGYGLKIFCRDEAGGREIINKVLDIQGHTPDWSLSSFNENQAEGSAYPAIPTNKTILGRSRKTARRRPVCAVRYEFAVAHIWGIAAPIPLHDRVYRFKDVLVE